jgi:calcineurin-like phosphoesterase family protein
MKNNEFITSDHHFGHENIIKYAKRPFKNKDEMNACFIEAWNNKVPKGSIVYHLGDFGFLNPKELSSIRHRLNGTIRLVLGNHDKDIDSKETRHLFEWIKPYYESKTEDGTKIVMCHYPFLTWSSSHHGSWNLHGHCHHSIDSLDMKTKRFDVGVDTTVKYSPDTLYAPYSFLELKKIMDKRTYVPVDHHK